MLFKLFTYGLAMFFLGHSWAFSSYLDENFELKRNCEEFYAELGVRTEKSLTPNTVEVATTGGRFQLNSIPDYKQKSVYIGIANHPTDGRHHYYLMVNGVRFDGWPIYRKPRSKRSNIGSEGVLFEVAVPEHVFEKISQEVAKPNKYRSITCAHAVCSLLDASGVQVGKGIGEEKITAKWLAASLVEGDLHLLGLPLDKKNIRWMATDENQSAIFLNSALAADHQTREEIKSVLATYGVVATLPILSGGYFIYILVHPEARSR